MSPGAGFFAASAATATSPAAGFFARRAEAESLLFLALAAAFACAVVNDFVLVGAAVRDGSRFCLLLPSVPLVRTVPFLEVLPLGAFFFADVRAWALADAADEGCFSTGGLAFALVATLACEDFFFAGAGEGWFEASFSVAFALVLKRVGRAPGESESEEGLE